MGTQRGRFSCVIPGGKQARVGGLYCVTIQVLSLRAEQSGARQSNKCYLSQKHRLPRHFAPRNDSLGT